MAQPSFPAYNVTGAVHHYIRTPATEGLIYYLGTCEVQPDIQIWELSANAMNDEAGRILPGQKTDQGQKADLALQMSRFSQKAYDILMTPRGINNGLTVDLGHQGRFSRGSLIFGVKTIELWQVFENATNVAFRGPNMPLGYYWPQVEVLNHAPVKLGTQETHLLIVAEAQPWKIPQANSQAVSGNERSWVLYQVDDAAFPADVLIPQ